MDYTKLIDLYFEGELNSVERELLFKELAQNTELQEYFENQIQFYQLFQKDLQTITIPAEVTNSIYSALNFNIPNAKYVATPSALSKFIVGLRTLSTRFLPYVVSSIVGGLVTFLLLWMFLPLNNKIEYNNGTINLATEQGIPVGNAAEVPKIVAGVEVANEKVQIEEVVLQTLEKWFANYLQNLGTFAHQTEETLDGRKINTITPAPVLPSSERATFMRTEASILTRQKIFAPNQTNLVVAPQTTKVLPALLRNITVGFRGYTQRSEPEVSVNLSERGLLTNSAISIGYNLGETSNIGFEFGQEKFAQKFTLSRYGEVTYYKQNPLLWWYGVYYQQSIGSLFRWENLKPMARVFLGGTAVGLLARGSLGLQYAPDSRVNLFLGWEGSILGYKVQDKIYQTKKSGITYGVSIRY